MFCPNCRAEYQSDVTTCPDCELELVPELPEETPKEIWGKVFTGETMRAWPFGADGKPERGAFLKHCTAVNMEDEMLVGMLASYGIPAVRRYPENGQLGKVVLGISGDGADIFVPQSQLSDAMAILGGSSDD